MKHEKPENFIISAQTIEDVLTYLSMRPFGEVVGLIGRLQLLIPFEPQKEETCQKQKGNQSRSQKSQEATN